MTDVVRPAPEVYRLSLEKLPFAVARERRLAFLKLAAATTAVVTLATPLAPSQHEAVDAAFVVATLAILALPYVLWRVGRRVRRHWNAFELAIGADTVRAAGKGAGRVTIRRAEVTDILEGGTGLEVRSAQPGVVVRVPRTVEGYLDARARLGQLRPIRGRADAVAWGAAALSAGLAGAASAPVWARAPGIGGGLVVCQLALAFVAGFEIDAHPRLSRGARLGGLVVVAVAGVAPLLALLRL